jgi:hypothetical protein
MKTKEQGLVHYAHQSQRNYFLKFDNMFTVLPDGKTIIGEDYDNYYMLVSEDITKNEKGASTEIHKRQDNIYTMFYHEVSESLFAGGCDKKLVQYKKLKDSQSWILVKDYGDVGIGCIYSVEQIGNLLVLGGSNNKVIAIDCVNQKALEGTVDTAIICIHSLQVCELPNQEIYLSVSGEGMSYSDEKSDLYNVTDLAKAFGYNFGTVLGNKHNQKNTFMGEDNQDHQGCESTD